MVSPRRRKPNINVCAVSDGGFIGLCQSTLLLSLKPTRSAMISARSHTHAGLDAAVSQDILDTLKGLTNTGLTAVMVVHQPRYSIFEMFDSVLLLGAGGRTVFLG